MTTGLILLISSYFLHSRSFMKIQTLCVAVIRHPDTQAQAKHWLFLLCHASVKQKWHPFARKWHRYQHLGTYNKKRFNRRCYLQLRVVRVGFSAYLCSTGLCRRDTFNQFNHVSFHFGCLRYYCLGWPHFLLTSARGTRKFGLPEVCSPAIYLKSRASQRGIPVWQVPVGYESSQNALFLYQAHSLLHSALSATIHHTCAGWRVLPAEVCRFSYIHSGRIPQQP